MPPAQSAGPRVHARGAGGPPANTVNSWQLYSMPLRSQVPCMAAEASQTDVTTMHQVCAWNGCAVTSGWRIGLLPVILAPDLTRIRDVMRAGGPLSMPLRGPYVGCCAPNTELCALGCARTYMHQGRGEVPPHLGFRQNRLPTYP